jgi:hypothetical protein
LILGDGLAAFVKEDILTVYSASSSARCIGDPARRSAGGRVVVFHSSDCRDAEVEVDSEGEYEPRVVENAS